MKHWLCAPITKVGVLHSIKVLLFILFNKYVIRYIRLITILVCSVGVYLSFISIKHVYMRVSQEKKTWSGIT